MHIIDILNIAQTEKKNACIVWKHQRKGYCMKYLKLHELFDVA